MLTDAAEGMSMQDLLLTPEDIVDRLVGSVSDEDVRAVIFWLNKLKDRSERDRVNHGHSESRMTPLVAACSKEASRTRKLIAHILRDRGATLPQVGEDENQTMWLELAQPWGMELLGELVGQGGEEEREAQELLAMSEADADVWIQQNLPPPPGMPEGYENQLDHHADAPYDSPDDEAGRSASVPVDHKASLRTIGHHASSPAPASATAANFPRSSLPPRPTTGTGMVSPVTIKREHHEAGIIDLTSSRSPSPVPKPEPQDDVPLAGPSSSRAQPSHKRPRSRSRSRERSASRGQPRRRRSPSPETRAHLRLDNLPLSYTSSAQLATVLADLEVRGAGEIKVQPREAMPGQPPPHPWALVTFSSLALAQHAYAMLQGTRIEGREVELKIYSAEGEPIDPFREVVPVVNNVDGRGPAQGQGERYRVGFSGGGGVGYGGGGPAVGADGAGAMGPPPPRYDTAPGGGGNQVFNRGPRYFPRPFVPVVFTAAELARRVYCGSMRYGITYDEVAELFSGKAGVIARVLKVMNAPDGSHSFGFVQLPDAITAEHALKTLHGTYQDGHLLQVERVNELGHRWLFSLALHGLPQRWQYRDVSDFLISTIGSFAGLIVQRDFRDGGLKVKVELRYKTELKWAAQELNGSVIDNRALEAVIEQPGVRREYEREHAYKRLVEDTQQRQAAAEGYDPYNPASTSSGGGGGAAYANNYPPLASGGGATPSRSRRAPPPPPPPPPAGSASPMVSVRSEATGTTSTTQLEDDDGYNPFAPSWLAPRK
ncbi:hypothetical protein JCM10207_007244 [Rhodosporidiobolus poonsookiae]